MKWTTQIQVTEPQRVVIAGLACRLEIGDVLNVVERPIARMPQIDGKTATQLLETDKAQDVTPEPDTQDLIMQGGRFDGWA